MIFVLTHIHSYPGLHTAHEHWVERPEPDNKGKNSQLLHEYMDSENRLDL